jgi:hypothetical protein
MNNIHHYYLLFIVYHHRGKQNKEAMKYVNKRLLWEELLNNYQ